MTLRNMRSLVVTCELCHRMDQADGSVCREAVGAAVSGAHTDLKKAARRRCR
jgi:hypothetical protein